MALMHVKFFSDVLGMCVEMDAIIPQAVKGQIGMGGVADGGPYQTLYLLHGMSDDHTIWQRRTSIERYASELGLAVIMPSTQLGWYTDMAHGLKWWTYISQELPQICRKFFPLSQKREDTFAAGLSMGGYGAAKLGLGAGEAFSNVATLSGGLDVRTIVSNPDPADGRGAFWTDVFGPAETVAGGENDLFALAESRKKLGNMPRIYQWCGTEDFLYDQNVAFRDHLQALGYDLTYEEGPGDHQWKYWDEKIQRVLEWLPLKKG
ncbi:MAG: esterase family protein [Clostridiales bacterium]|jgi:putative tributyrin esterase|nr:esterase family protein [Clostridiales bacterium]